MQNEKMVAALLGPEYIPLYRRQQKKRSRKGRVQNIHGRWMLYKDRLLDTETILVTNRDLNDGIVIKTDVAEWV